jgi:hypothetical protein
MPSTPRDWECHRPFQAWHRFATHYVTNTSNYYRVIRTPYCVIHILSLFGFCQMVPDYVLGCCVKSQLYSGSFLLTKGKPAHKVEALHLAYLILYV